MSLGRRRILIFAALFVLAALIGGRAASGLYVEALWFGHLGYGRFFWSFLGYRLLAGTAAAVLVGAFLFANLYPLTRQHPRIQIRRRYGDIEIAELFPQSYLLVGALAVSAVFAAVMGLYVGRFWTLPIVMRLNAPSWARVDPVLGRDVGAYVFDLPVSSGLHGFAAVVLLGTIVAVSLAYVMYGGLAYVDGRVTASDMARRHLGILAGLAFLLLAWGYRLGMQELLWAGNGVTDALGYTDVNARFPGHRILIALGIIGAGATFYGAYRRTFLYGIVSVVVVLLGGLIIDRAYPTAIQNLRVEPNELERESLYLTWNLEFTRAGYGLDAFEDRDYPLDLARMPDQATTARVTAGLPLWDTRPLRATYNQFQGINPYYTFADVDYDRYGTQGQLQQVAVAVREIDLDQLPPVARTWQNLHLSENYTHGLGLVMSPAARITAAGEPAYYMSGIPPSATADAPAETDLVWPSVYFGEKTSQYVLLRPEEPRESAAPAAPPAPAGPGGPPPPPQPLGVSLDSFTRKLAFAWSLGDRNLLLSQEVRPGTRIVYERTVQRRVARLAPFLALDPDIYPVVFEGRIVWVQDAYTVSPHFPLSQRIATAWGPINYMRNSVKITVDALTGSVNLYIVDPDDPIIASLQGAFPSLFRPLQEMPQELRRHLRYARELLLVQAQVLRAYHVEDARALYHQLDLWDFPVERYREGEEEVRPYYVVMPDPASESGELEYLLMFPFTAHGRDNMRAFMVARSDVSQIPQVTLFRLPSEQVLGPRQVEVQIDQDPLISQQFTLWQQRGSRVIRGHLLVVPVEGTFLYIEPIFLEAEGGGAAPSLSRVIAASPTRVAIAETLEGALAALHEGSSTSALLDELTLDDPTSPHFDRLRELIERGDSALRNGDVAEFGRLWAEIRRLAREAQGAPQQKP
ncbi:MAG: UPF0182 family protein [Gemmatimonadota bacterium]